MGRLSAEQFRKERVPQLFETSIQQVNSSVGTVASLVWDPTSRSITTYGALGSVPSGSTLTNPVIINTGTNVIYAGMGSAAAAATTGAAIQPGGRLVFEGYSQVAGTTTAGQIWAQTGVVGQTSSTVAGMATIAQAGVI